MHNKVLSAVFIVILLLVFITSFHPIYRFVTLKTTISSTKHGISELKKIDVSKWDDYISREDVQKFEFKYPASVFNISDGFVVNSCGLRGRECDPAFCNGAISGIFLQKKSNNQGTGPGVRVEAISYIGTPQQLLDTCINGEIEYWKHNIEYSNKILSQEELKNKTTQILKKEIVDNGSITALKLV